MQFSQYLDRTSAFNLFFELDGHWTERHLSRRFEEATHGFRS